MWKSILLTSGPDPNLSVAILVLFLIIVFLTHKKQKEKEGVQSYQPEKLRNSLKYLYVSLKWLFDPSTRKGLLLENFYQSNLLKEVVNEGRPKFFKIFNFTGLFIADDYDSIKDIIHSKDCNEVVPPPLANIVTGGHGHRTGFMFTGGPHWNELRKYTVRKLGQLGFHKRDKLSLLLSELLLDLTNNLSNIKNSTQNKIPVKDLFVFPAINIVWCIIGGHKFLPDDQKFLTIYNNVQCLGHLPLWKFALLSILPNNKLIQNIMGCRSFCNAARNLNEFMKQLVDERMTLGKTEPEDFVDHFILEIEKHKNNVILKDYYCADQLAQILAELFEGGTDTTSKFLEFSLMYMVQHLEIQKKVQREIDSVIGISLPSYSDHKNSMPYTVATIMEIHRMANILPLVPRFTERNWKHNGKILEKGNQIICVMCALRMNESFWGDPSSFRPERFLNEDNSFIMEKMNRVLPFSTGLRSCPGESVASASTFTFFVGTLQKYTVTKAVENELLGIDHTICGYVNQPFPFHVSLLERM